MKKLTFKFFETINKVSRKILKDTFLIFWVAWIIAMMLFSTLEGASIDSLAEKIAQSNSYLQTQAMQIVEDKDFNIELNEYLTKYKIEETEDSYYIKLYGPESNVVNITCDKNFVISKLSTTDALLLVGIIFCLLYFLFVYYILKLITFIIEKITLKITSLKIFEEFKELEDIKG